MNFLEGIDQQENVTLRLNNRGMNDVVLSEFVDLVINSKINSIETLDLSCNLITSVGAKKLAELFHVIDCKNIILAYNFLGDRGYGLIAQSLRRAMNTHYLDISFNGVTNRKFTTSKYLFQSCSVQTIKYKDAEWIGIKSDLKSSRQNKVRYQRNSIRFDTMFDQFLHLNELLA